MTCPLTAPDVPINEPAKTYTAVAVDLDFAHLRARYAKPCGTCRAIHEEPCRTPSGKVTRRHARRPR